MTAAGADGRQRDAVDQEVLGRPLLATGELRVGTRQLTDQRPALAFGQRPIGDQALHVQTHSAWSRES